MNDHNIPSDQLTLHRRPLDALTGIRFFAAIYVVLYHSKLPIFFATHHQTIASNFFNNGFLAVSLFFLLSGFILSYTYSGRVRNASERRRFWEARVARLYPVYLLSLLLTSAVHLSIPKWSYAIPTILMLQAWNPFDKAMWGAWNYVCWTLSVEAFFYLVFPSCQRWIEKLSSHGRVILSFAMLGLGVLLNSGVRVLGYPTHGILSAVPLPLLRLPEFLAGIGLGNFFLYYDSRSKLQERQLLPGRGVLTYVSAIAALLLLCRAVGPLTSLVLIPFSVLILCLAAEVTLLTRFLSSRWIVFGGAISYAVYLLQVAAKDFAISAASRLHITSVGLRFSATLVILLTLSALAYKLVELPGREKLRALLAGIEKRRLSVPATKQAKQMK
jgi:peptidoglycan/LPS O-acetylase OafA/YrhL